MQNWSFISWQFAEKDVRSGLNSPATFLPSKSTGSSSNFGPFFRAIYGGNSPVFQAALRDKIELYVKSFSGAKEKRDNSAVLFKMNFIARTD